MTMTAPGCGMGDVLRADIERKLAQLPEVREVHAEIVFDPPWNPGRMSDAAKLQLGLDLDSGSQLPVYRSWGSRAYGASSYRVSSAMDRIDVSAGRRGSPASGRSGALA